jgi:hypothetical protein
MLRSPARSPRRRGPAPRTLRSLLVVSDRITAAPVMPCVIPCVLTSDQAPLFPNHSVPDRAGTVRAGTSRS